MRNGFVFTACDIGDLQSTILNKLSDNPILCSSLSEIATLQDAEVVYFVVSETSLCSTAYQQLVFAVLDAVNQSNRRLLRLDNVPIPLGFKALASLPEGAPD